MVSIILIKRLILVVLTVLFGSVSDVFRFTLYWTLIFGIPLYFLCGIYAFLNLTFSPSRRQASSPLEEMTSSYPLTEPNQSQASKVDNRQPVSKGPRLRSRVTFALIVLASFLALSIIGAVIGSAIVGYILAGLFRAANFNMST